jgi:hypothetical protein
MSITYKVDWCVLLHKVTSIVLNLITAKVIREVIAVCNQRRLRGPAVLLERVTLSLGSRNTVRVSSSTIVIVLIIRFPKEIVLELLALLG